MESGQQSDKGNMKYLNLIIFLAIALCIALLWGYTKDLGEEVLDLREGYRLLRQENAQLRTDLALSNHNAQRIIDEFRKILEGKRLIPVFDYRTFLVYDVDSMNEVLDLKDSN